MNEAVWQEELRTAFRSPEELAAYLNLSLTDLPPLPARSSFAFLVPRPFASRIVRGNPRDPLLREVWPDADEDMIHDGERLDPVGDDEARCEAGLLHKYRGRMLLVTTGACAVHCRYCFRQFYPYREETGDVWKPALAKLREDTSIHEVLLSGGDPLSLSDAALERLVGELESIPHLKTLRIHSRLPVVIPSRIDDRICQMLERTRLRPVMVLHTDHAKEIDEDVKAACRRLRKANVTLLNQSVLLAGVNASPETLADLSMALWEAGVLPYYLHALDPVQGARRFAMPDREAVKLMETLRTLLPGYLVPRLVRELSGEPSKTPLF